MTFKRRIKLSVYAVAKWTGLFAISRFLMRRRLLILGYHGFQYTDEARFRPILFMDPQCFSRRLDLLARGKYQVLPLADGVNRYRNGTLPAKAVSISIDDGFFSVLDLAAPLLREYGFPATLYVTSYYVTKNAPIFRLVIQYLFWKTSSNRFGPLDEPWFSGEGVDLADSHAAEQLIWSIIEYGEANCDEESRQQICARVAAELGVDYPAIREGRGLALLTPDELGQLDEFGIDVQLHTHRHTFPSDDLDRARRELRENRSILEEILGRRLTHFCYPSGEWEPNVLPVLSEEGIDSAVTCQAGMNDRATDPLALYRILDQDDLHDLEFEAELTGFGELIRIISGRRRRTDAIHRVGV